MTHAAGDSTSGSGPAKHRGGSSRRTFNSAAHGGIGPVRARAFGGGVPGGPSMGPSGMPRPARSPGDPASLALAAMAGLWS